MPCIGNLGFIYPANTSYTFVKTQSPAGNMCKEIQQSCALFAHPFILSMKTRKAENARTRLDQFLQLCEWDVPHGSV
jgi:hypothetical protein